jgi:hypothetical protein
MAVGQMLNPEEEKELVLLLLMAILVVCGSCSFCSSTNRSKTSLGVAMLAV